MSISSMGKREGDVVVRRVVRDSVPAVTARGVRHKLPEEGVCDNRGVVLLPLGPDQIVVGQIGGALYCCVTVDTSAAVLVTF